MSKAAPLGDFSDLILSNLKLVMNNTPLHSKDFDLRNLHEPSWTSGFFWEIFNASGSLKRFQGFRSLHPGKLTWQWKNQAFEDVYITYWKWWFSTVMSVFPGENFQWMSSIQVFELPGKHPPTSVEKPTPSDWQVRNVSDTCKNITRILLRYLRLMMWHLVPYCFRAYLSATLDSSCNSWCKGAPHPESASKH